jgi:putative Mg2+ transporter-C (MgtC) family protein
MDALGALETLGKLAAAVGLGGVIGLERETHHRPAGFRTHMVVCLGACLFMLVSLKIGELDPGSTDRSRIASQVVPGIGFLGAGTILKTGFNVKGLTTAACLWTAAAIGLAVGAGYWSAALFTTGLTLVAIFALRGVERRVAGGERLKLMIQVQNRPGMLATVEEALRQGKADVAHLDLHDGHEERAEISVGVRVKEEADFDALLRRLRDVPGVERVERD